ncbi:MAG: hypothetical protein ACXAC8_08915 [Candidatus Hodarchaeales archaeon]
MTEVNKASDLRHVFYPKCPYNDSVIVLVLRLAVITLGTLGISFFNVWVGILYLIYSRDGFSALVQTTDGGFALAGWTESFGAGMVDMWLVKTNVTGNVTWNQTYGGTDPDEANALVQTVDGGFALAGWTGNTSTTRDMWLVKTDTNGMMTWNQSYGGPDKDIAYSLVQTGDDGFALAGSTESFGAKNVDMWLVKTDANGIVLWHQTYHQSPNSDNGGSVLIQTTDGGFALAGWTSGRGSLEMWLVKTDATGVIVWHQIYRDPECFEVTGTTTPTLGWGPLSLLVAAVVLTTWSKRHKKLE